MHIPRSVCQNHGLRRPITTASDENGWEAVSRRRSRCSLLTRHAPELPMPPIDQVMRLPIFVAGFQSITGRKRCMIGLDFSVNKSVKKAVKKTPVPLFYREMIKGKESLE